MSGADYGDRIKKQIDSGGLPKASQDYRALKQKQGDVGELFQLAGNPAVENLTIRSWAAGPERIVWRSDTREPEEMFRGGFTAWDAWPPHLDRYNLKDEQVPRDKDGKAMAMPVVPRSDQVPIWRTGQEDIDPDSAVCMAVDIRGAAFFPLENPMKNPWVYGCVLKQGIDTCAIQKAINEKKAWVFNERCTNRIEGRNVVFAVRCERQLLWEKMRMPEKSSASGIRFHLLMETAQVNPYLRSIKRDRLESRSTSAPVKDVELEMEHYQQKIDKYVRLMTEMAGQYSAWYPKIDSLWLDYHGKELNAEKMLAFLSKPVQGAEAVKAASQMDARQRRYLVKFIVNSELKTQEFLATNQMTANKEGRRIAQAAGGQLAATGMAPPIVEITD